MESKNQDSNFKDKNTQNNILNGGQNQDEEEKKFWRLGKGNFSHK